jgi:hypothetical protein
MSKVDLDARVAALEAEVARLKGIVEPSPEPEKSGWEKLALKYADDPSYDEATRLGKEYRDSLRPKTRKRKKV